MPVGHINFPEGLQYSIAVGAHGRSIAGRAYDQAFRESLRICTEEEINNMSDGSFKLYRQKIFALDEGIHVHGTPEAIRTIDFLKSACGRSKDRRDSNA
jgi:hypothetical protein